MCSWLRNGLRAGTPMGRCGSGTRSAARPARGHQPRTRCSSTCRSRGSGTAAEARLDICPGHLGPVRPLDGWRVDPVTVKLEHRVAAQHEKQLLVRGAVALVVLANDEVTRRAGRPGSRSERCDAQVVQDRPVVTACVREFYFYTVGLGLQSTV